MGGGSDSRRDKIREAHIQYTAREVVHFVLIITGGYFYKGEKDDPLIPRLDMSHFNELERLVF